MPSTVDENSQAELFLRSKKPTRTSERLDRPWALPFGGGSFKGFCFVILENEDEASRILKEWQWDHKECGDDSVMEFDAPRGGSKSEITQEKLAGPTGLRALS